MKKMKIDLTRNQIIGLDEWLTDYLPKMNIDYEFKCVAAVLHQWQHDKLKPKTYVYTDKPVSFKLNMPQAYAFASIIELCSPSYTTYLGITLLKLYNQISETFNN
jgi:hypothetical protein